MDVDHIMREEQRILEIVRRLFRSDPLTQEEVSYIVDRASNPPSDASLSHLLSAVARLIGVEAEEVVSIYLDRLDNPNVVGFALKALREMGVAQKYKEKILLYSEIFLEHDVRSRLAASSLNYMGWYLRHQRDEDYERVLCSKLLVAPDVDKLSKRDLIEASTARMAASNAMGADMAAIVGQPEAIHLCVQRFLATHCAGV